MSERQRVCRRTRDIGIGSLFEYPWSTMLIASYETTSPAVSGPYIRMCVLGERGVTWYGVSLDATHAVLVGVK